MAKKLNSSVLLSSLQPLDRLYDAVTNPSNLPMDSDALAVPLHNPKEPPSSSISTDLSTPRSVTMLSAPASEFLPNTPTEPRITSMWSTAPPGINERCTCDASASFTRTPSTNTLTP